MYNGKGFAVFSVIKENITCHRKYYQYSIQTVQNTNSFQNTLLIKKRNLFMKNSHFMPGSGT